MKSLAFAAFAASVAISAQVFAADTASKFEGFSAEFASGYQQTKMGNGPVYANVTGAVTATSVGSGSSNNVPAVVGINFGIKVSSQFIVGLGATYDMTTASVNGTCSGGGCTSVVTTKIKNRYNLFIAPGVQTSESGLAYVKLGYSGVSASSSVSDGSVVTSGLKTTAISYGAGYKQFFNNNLYGFAEIDYAGHGSGNQTGTTVFYSSDIKTTSYLVGIGYKF